MKPRPKSETIYKGLCEVIPGGVNSPIRACKAVDYHPLVAERAFDDMIVDADGNHYIDYCGSWGALIHGHAHPEILKAAEKRMSMGTTFGVTTAIEGRLARKIIELVPSIEKVRFVSSGTEATMSAVRLAKGYTKRDLIVKFAGNYHGHADYFLVKAGSGVAGLPESSSAGIPQELVSKTLCLPYNDVACCNELFGNMEMASRIAAVIVEPIAGNMGVVCGTHEFLFALRELTEKNGSLLIFDEVMSGFRVAKGGAQQLYGIDPDLTCLGKIIGGGFPAAAFGGKAKIMDCLAPLGAVYQAGTLSGNPVAMEAGLKALELLDVPNYYQTLQQKVDFLTQFVQAYIDQHKIPACLQGAGSMFTLFLGRRSVSNMDEAQSCDKELFKKFYRHMFENGVYIPPLMVEAWFISMAHTEEHLKTTSNLIVEFLEKAYVQQHLL